MLKLLLFTKNIYHVGGPDCWRLGCLDNSGSLPWRQPWFAGMVTVPAYIWRLAILQKSAVAKAGHADTLFGVCCFEFVELQLEVTYLQHSWHRT